MPGKDNKIGRGNKVIFKDTKFELNELINSFKFWSKQQGYHIFKNEDLLEIQTPKGIKMDAKIHFAKNIDNYFQSKFDVEIKARRCKKITAKNNEGKLKTLYQGNIVVTIDSSLLTDRNDTFTNKGKFVDYIHHFMYEFIYEPRFNKYKVNTGINTGGSMSIVKNHLKKYEDFIPVSFS